VDSKDIAIEKIEKWEPPRKRGRRWSDRGEGGKKLSKSIADKKNLERGRDLKKKGKCVKSYCIPKGKKAS